MKIGHDDSPASDETRMFGLRAGESVPTLRNNSMQPISASAGNFQQHINLLTDANLCWFLKAHERACATAAQCWTIWSTDSGMPVGYPCLMQSIV